VHCTAGAGSRTYPHTLVSHRIIASQDTRETDALTQVQVTQVTPHSTQLALLVMHVHVHRTSAIATVWTQSHSVEPLVTPPTTHLLAHRSTSYIPCVFLPSAVDPARGGLTLKGSAMNAPPRARASSNTPLGSLPCTRRRGLGLQVWVLFTTMKPLRFYVRPDPCAHGPDPFPSDQ
jgi:hypothetical protein